MPESLPRSAMDPGVFQSQGEGGALPGYYLPATRTLPKPPTKPLPTGPPPTKPLSSLKAHPKIRASALTKGLRLPVEERHVNFFPERSSDGLVIWTGPDRMSPTPAMKKLFPTLSGRKYEISTHTGLDPTFGITSAGNPPKFRSELSDSIAQRAEDTPSVPSTLGESPSKPKRMPHQKQFRSFTLTLMIAIFKWVRGELISRGTYGKVYVAWDVATGERVAVEQVEIPRAENYRSDSREATAMEVLRREGRLLKELDHPNIVRYLGFEETPRYFNMSVLFSDY